MSTKLRFTFFSVISLSLIWGIYFGSSARLLLNVGDSDDLTLASFNGSLAHPPGYPILIMGLHLTRSLWTIPTDWLTGIRLVQTLIAVINIGLLALVVKVYREPNSSARLSIEEWLPVMFGVAIWGLSDSVWLNATILEVFPMATMGCLIFLWAGRCYWLNKSQGKRNWLWLMIATISGIVAVFSHPLTGIVVMGVVFLNLIEVIKNDKKIWLTTAIFTILLITSGYIVLAGKTSFYRWPMERSLNGLIQFVSRQQYTLNGSAIETYTRTFNLKHSIASLGIWIKIFWNDWGLLVGWGLIGMLDWRFRKPKWRIAMLSMLGISGPLLILYLKFPLAINSTETEYFWGTFLRYRMLFVFNLLWGILVANGLMVTFDYFNNKRIRYIGYFTLAILISWQVVNRWPERNISQDNFNFLWSQKILTDLPSSAVIIIDNDVVFSLLAAQQIYAIRPDVLIVPARIPVVQETVDLNLGAAVSGIKTEVNQDRELSRMVMAWLYAHKRVFLFNPTANWLKLLGVEGNPLFVAPYGYTLEINLRMPKIEDKYDYGLSQQLADYTVKDDDWWLLGLKGTLAEIHTQLMYFYGRLGYIEAAKIHQQLAMKLSQLPTTKEIIEETNQTAYNRYKNYNSYNNYFVPSVREYLDKSIVAASQNRKDEATYYLDRAWILDPEVKY
jgi:hypothetical protein